MPVSSELVAPDGAIDGLLTEKSMRLNEKSGSSNAPTPATAVDLEELPPYSALVAGDDAPSFVLPPRSDPPDAAEQRRAVYAVKDKPLRNGDTWYLVGRAWYRAWDSSCAEDNEKAAQNVVPGELGPIDSSTLQEPTSEPTDLTPPLRLGVQEGVDYELIPEEAWRLLASWFGVEGPSFPRKVIQGAMPGQLRIELNPLRLHIALLAPPFRAMAPLPPSQTATASEQHTFTMSVSKDIGDLKLLVKQQFDMVACQDTDIRFWRAPPELVPALVDETQVLTALEHDDVELVNAGEEEGLQRRALSDIAELQTASPDVYLLVETRDLSNTFLLKEDGQVAEAPVAATAATASSTAPAPLFAQPAGDFFSNIQKMSPATIPAPPIVPTSSSASSNLFQRQTRSQTAADRNAGRTKGLVGLQNLGNTCFMNSALQCLSNTKELQEYFVSGAYKSELNADNPLGQGGALAQAFGALLNKLWDGHQSSYAPREFKMALSRFAPQFIGYQQQDTQELLAFLLDGLHEDLNRILKKPYIEAPEWEGGGAKEMVELAAKQWEIYKLRNDSVIVDMFQGQYRSTLVCPVCSKVSIKFDPFMYLTLPLPNMKRWKGKATFVPYDASKPTVNFDITLPANSTLGQMRAKLGSWFSLDPKRIICGEIFNGSVYRWWHDYDPVSEIMANDRLYFWEVPCDYTPPKREGAPSYSIGYGKLAMLPEQLEATVKEVPAKDQPAVLMVFSEVQTTTGSSYRRSRAEKFGIPFLIALPADQLEDQNAVYDVVLRQYMRYTERPEDLQAIIDSTGAVDSGTISEQVEPASTASADAPNGDVAMATSVPALADLKGDADVELVSEEPIHNQGTAIITEASVPAADTKTMLFQLRFTGRVPTEDFPKSGEDWETCSEDLTERAARLSKARESASSPEDGLETEATNEQSDSDADVEGTVRRKQARGVRASDRQASLTPWPLLYTGGGLVCVWNATAKAHFFEEATSGMADWGRSETFEDPEIQSLRAAAASRRKTELTIDNCLDEFTKEEQLGEDDPWYCPRCKEFRQATKKFDLWEVPDILVVHLKRFSGGRSARDKLEDLVSFPLEGLDLSDRVESRKAKDNGGADDEKPIYDLYAVDNHYGGLGGGHYTAYAKNPMDGKWYYFDDSSVRAVEPTSVQSTAAYVLFYRRRTSRSIGGKSQDKIKAALQPIQTKSEQEAHLTRADEGTQAMAVDGDGGYDAAPDTTGEYAPMDNADWLQESGPTWSGAQLPSPSSDGLESFRALPGVGRRWSTSSSQHVADSGSSRRASPAASEASPRTDHAPESSDIFEHGDGSESVRLDATESLP